MFEREMNPLIKVMQDKRNKRIGFDNVGWVMVFHAKEITDGWV
jgi:hypothetical protein